MIKIYFAGAVRAGRENQEAYFKMIERLKEYGQVLTEHIGRSDLTTNGESIPEEKIFERDMGYIRESDVLVAEVSTPSLGVGYEIGVAESLDKKVICLYKKPEDGRKISGMIKGNGKLTLKQYDDLNEALQFIDDYFNNGQ
ncbi:MAG: nucleoside 2-deoxyribosyltransferase [Candidatus Pacebacteria bacterium]|nr:nucleoside 2-deoxyribosyltransferase [Candidatus Paceibacterota bacterium]